MTKFRRVSDDVLQTMKAECEGTNSVLERLVDEVTTARSARASEVTGVAGRLVFQVVTLEVRVGASVPFDMLRYDRCTPLTEQDSNKMERLAAADGSCWGGVDDRTIKVLRTSPNGGMPAVGRWASFGITVTDVKRGWTL